MGFVKVVKNSSYFRRYQVQFRRRREAKTDYQQRRKLVFQEKNKYQTPKYRFVVRFTNRDVVCQIFFADLLKDNCLCAAYSHELKRYGLPVGLTNYAAAYCTGLLLARRVDRKFRLGYEGNTEVNGVEYHVKDDRQGMAPFKAFLDVGLCRTTTGARVFGALKGACDGGLNIPHKTRRFPGSHYDKDTKKWSYDPSVHRSFIFGVPVANYMRKLQEENSEKYAAHFSRYIAAGLGPDNLEERIRRVHALIRKNPNRPRDPTELGYFGEPRPSPKIIRATYENKRFSKLPKTLAQRKASIREKLTKMGKKKQVL
jgi:large subunit ribosomal protein L5e